MQHNLIHYGHESNTESFDQTGSHFHAEDSVGGNSTFTDFTAFIRSSLDQSINLTCHNGPLLPKRSHEAALALTMLLQRVSIECSVFKACERAPVEVKSHTNPLTCFANFNTCKTWADSRAFSSATEQPFYPNPVRLRQRVKVGASIWLEIRKQ